ncbi:hypothetical protein pb186bvf_005865 [Paramecium bursaria]
MFKFILYTILLHVVLSQVAGGYQKQEQNLKGLDAGLESYISEQFASQAKGCKLEHIIGVYTQVVSGTNYKIIADFTCGKDLKRYEMVVYDQPWTSTRKVTSFKELDIPMNYKKTDFFQLKGWTEVTNEALAQQVLYESAYELNKIDGKFNEMDLTEIDITQLFYGGWMYKVELTYKSQQYGFIYYKSPMEERLINIVKK